MSVQTIHRFRVAVADEVTLRIPVPARIVHVDDRDGAGATLDVWAIVDPDAVEAERHLAVAGTGHRVPGGEHIATVITAAGQLVWHVFDLDA